MYILAHLIIKANPKKLPLQHASLDKNTDIIIVMLLQKG